MSSRADENGGLPSIDRHARAAFRPNITAGAGSCTSGGKLLIKHHPDVHKPKIRRGGRFRLHFNILMLRGFHRRGPAVRGTESASSALGAESRGCYSNPRSNAKETILRSVSEKPRPAFSADCMKETPSVRSGLGFTSRMYGTPSLPIRRSRRA